MARYIGPDKEPSSVVSQANGDLYSALAFRLWAANPAKAGTPTDAARMPATPAKRMEKDR